MNQSEWPASSAGKRVRAGVTISLCLAFNQFTKVAKVAESNTKLYNKLFLKVNEKLLYPKTAETAPK